jgi:hypothetical protein
MESLVISSQDDIETSITAGIGGSLIAVANGGPHAHHFFLKISALSCSSGVKRLVLSQQQMLTSHSFFKSIELDG